MMKHKKQIREGIFSEIETFDISGIAKEGSADKEIHKMKRDTPDGAYIFAYHLNRTNQGSETKLVTA